MINTNWCFYHSILNFTFPQTYFYDKHNLRIWKYFDIFTMRTFSTHFVQNILCQLQDNNYSKGLITRVGMELKVKTQYCRGSWMSLSGSEAQTHLRNVSGTKGEQKHEIGSKAPTFSYTDSLLYWNESWVSKKYCNVTCRLHLFTQAQIMDGQIILHDVRLKLGQSLTKVQ